MCQPRTVSGGVMFASPPVKLIRHDRTHAPQQILGDTAGTNLPLGDASIAEIIARSAFLPGAEALQ